MKCPDAIHLQELLDEELRGEEFRQIEAHVEDCAGCQATLEQLLAGDAEAETPPQSAVSKPSKGQASAGQALVPDFIGKYRIVERLGGGGQGEVFRAVHPTLGRDVVIKWGRRRLPPAQQEKLIDEGRVLARLDDSGVARVYDVDVCDGRPYVVLEYVAGQTLADVLRRQRLSFRAAAALMAKAAGILHRLHHGGLLHRDLKPANILLDSSHRPRLLDFGLASLTKQWGEINPPEKSISGTVWYMAPEQASGQPERIGPRTDVFGLGAVLYAMLTGRPPYVGQDPVAVLELARKGQVTPPRQVNPSIPRLLARICRKALAADPEKRYASAGQMQQALHLFLWRGRLLAVASGVMVVVALLLMWRPWAAPFGDKVPGRNGSNERLHVDELKVLLAESIDNKKTRPRQVVGIETFGATLDDDIKVSAHLSRPAYCYLIVFRPDGVNEVLFPQSPGVAPELTAEPQYPSVDRGKVYGMSDGTGLWLVALVASDQPLPAYAEWQKVHRLIPWTRSVGEPNCVWIDDGQWLERVRPGGIRNRGDRGEKEAPGNGPIVRLVNWLKAETGGTVSAVAFTVQAKK